MANFYDMSMKFMFIGLIVISVFAFIITFQNENDAENKIIDDSLINGTYTSLNADLQEMRDQAQNQREVFELENPVKALGYFIFDSIITSGKIFSNIVVGLFNTIIQLPVKVLGIDPLIVGILSSMIIITILIGLWIVYKVGG